MTDVKRSRRGSRPSSPGAGKITAREDSSVAHRSLQRPASSTDAQNSCGIPDDMNAGIRVCPPGLTTTTSMPGAPEFARPEPSGTILYAPHERKTRPFSFPLKSGRSAFRPRPDHHTISALSSRNARSRMHRCACLTGRARHGHDPYPQSGPCRGPLTTTIKVISY